MGYLFQTERLGIRELVSEDAPDLAKVLCDPASMVYYPRPFTNEEVSGWIERNIRRYRIYGYGLWALESLKDKTFVGDCGITIQRIDHELLPELGFHILPAYRRQGFAAEASLAVLQYVALKFNLATVFSYCDKENLPSQRTMIKAGFTYFKEYTEESLTKVVFSKSLIPESGF